MNREIKFRVWDKYEKQMYPISSIDYDIFSQEIRIIAVGHKNGMCTAYNKNHNSEKCDITALELMQYTGLRDKNGKEIYEGDIVKITGSKEIDIGKVIYEYNGFIVDVMNMDRFYGRVPLLEKFTEVIGNIYEDSELLGGE
jgi:uncharacterized phage protein (TIGR01671 family)